MVMDFFKRTRKQMILLLFFAFFTALFIVNYGNILTDGNNEREYLKRNTMNCKLFKVKIY